MPTLDPLPVGKAIADYFIDNASPAGTEVSRAKLEQLWQGAIGILYADLQANLGILPGTFQVTGVMPGGATVAVTGIGGPAS